MRTMQYIVIVLLCVLTQKVSASLNIEHWQTASGVNVYFVENHDLPILDVSVEFSAGSSMDTADKSGLANLVRHLLNLGTKDLSEDQIATALADIGAQLGGNFDRDRAGVTLRTLSNERERIPALKVLASIIQFPQFPQDVLTREKARIVASIKESSMKPDYIADRELTKMLYGAHAYGLNDVGEIETVNALQRDDLLAFYRSNYVSKNAVVAMIGDVTKQQAKEIAESLTQHLPAGQKHIDPPQVQIPSAETKKIPHPATQSHIQFAYPGLRRGDPDYFPLLVGNHVLGGGGFVSRLMEEIRQKRGLAYSVYSFFSPFKQQGPFLVGLQTKKEQSEEAFALTRKTLSDFVSSGPTQAELDTAKQNLIGGFALRIDSNSKILGYLSMIGFYQLPLTYLTDYLTAVEAVTVEQVREAFKRRIQPDGMVAVIVGAAE